MKTVPTEAAVRLCAMRDVDVCLGVTLPSYRTPASAPAAVSPPSASCMRTAGSSGGRGVAVGAAPDTTLRVDGGEVDSLQARYTLQVPLEGLYGAVHAASLARTQEVAQYLDDVWGAIDDSVDDLYCGW